MKHMARIYSRRKGTGKDTRFKRRGLEIPITKPLKYWKRKSRSIDEVVQESMPHTPDDIVCYTPVPSPISSPHELGEQERLLLNTRNYTSARFEDGTWIQRKRRLYRTKSNGNFSFAIGNLITSCDVACSIFSSGDATGGRRVLHSAMANLEAIVSMEAPGILMTLLHCSHVFRRLARPELSIIFLRQVSEIVETSFPAGHVLRNICHLFLTDSLHHLRIVESTMECILDCFDTEVGETDGYTIALRSQYYGDVYSRRDETTAITKLRALGVSCMGREAMNGELLNVLRALSRVLHARQRSLLRCGGGTEMLT